MKLVFRFNDFMGLLARSLARSTTQTTASNAANENSNAIANANQLEQRESSDSGLS